MESNHRQFLCPCLAWYFTWEEGWARIFIMLHTIISECHAREEIAIKQRQKENIRAHLVYVTWKCWGPKSGFGYFPTVHAPKGLYDGFSFPGQRKIKVAISIPPMIAQEFSTQAFSRVCIMLTENKLTAQFLTIAVFDVRNLHQDSPARPCNRAWKTSRLALLATKQTGQ